MQKSAQGARVIAVIFCVFFKQFIAVVERLYCARGEMENRIKEQQLDLFADRTSCHRWWPNQFRLLLLSLGYILLEAIRRLALISDQI